MKLMKITNTDLVEMHNNQLMQTTAMIASLEGDEFKASVTRMIESRRISSYIRVDTKQDPPLDFFDGDLLDVEGFNKAFDEWHENFYEEHDNNTLMAKDFLIEKDGEWFLRLDKHELV